MDSILDEIEQEENNYNDFVLEQKEEELNRFKEEVQKYGVVRGWKI